MPDQALTLTEAVGNLGNMQAADGSPGRFKALLIKAGWGSCGYYPEEVLRRDGPAVWPAGTQMYLNHPTITESIELPERDVLNLASETTTDPVWDPAEGGLVAEVEVFPQWQGLLNKKFASTIGLSIRAVGIADDGEAEGRSGPIVNSITEGLSVDWVTKAGAGGRVLELIESARQAPTPPEPEPEKPLREAQRNVGQWMESRIHHHFTEVADDMYGNGKLTRPERIGLSNAIGDGLKSFTSRVTTDHPQLYERDIYDGPPDEAAGPVSEAVRRRFREAHGMTANELAAALVDEVRETYGGEGIYVWLRDNTDEWCVFSLETDSECQLFQQTYTIDEDTREVTLTGEPVEVTARTEYVPAPPEPEDPAESNDDSLTETDPQNAPGSPPAETEKEKEGSMPELNEAEARALTEARDTALAEAQKATAQAETALAEKAASDLQLARFRAAESARPIAATLVSESTLPGAAQAKLLNTFSATDAAPLTDAGALDESAFRTKVADAIKAEATYLAQIAEGDGQGTPRGLGESASEGVATEDAAATKAALVEAYKQRGMTASAAELAATGRPF